MLTDVIYVTVLVADVDEALAWYTETMGLEVRDDREFGPGVRWVTVAPGEADTELVLQEPDPAYHGKETAEAMRDRIGKGTMIVLATDDCRETVAELADRGVTVRTGPTEVPWGVHAIVEDLYGNPYDVVEEQ